MTEELKKTFQVLKQKIAPYAKKLSTLMDTPHRFELCAEGDYVITSQRTGKTEIKKNPYFVGLMLQKSHVGFYFMPVYVEPSLMDQFSNDFNRKKKGKSCFYFRKEQEVTEEVDELLKKGYTLYKDRGWVK